MLGRNQYYYRTIRKMVVAFGTLFNDITIRRYNKAGTLSYEVIKIPLAYSQKEKFVTRLTSDPNLTKSIATLLPRMSFDMGGMSYDNSRKQVTMTRNFAANTAIGTINKQFAPVPYNFDFNLSIYARNTEDGTQILEQIIPFFTPDFTVSVNLMPNMEQKYDIPIILNSITSSVDYEGDLMSTRMMTWDLTFTVKGYFFPIVDEAEIIREANTNIYIDTQKREAQKVYVNFDTGNNAFVTGETIKVTDRGIDGKVIYFSNNITEYNSTLSVNTSTLIVGELSDTLKVDDVVTGEYSNSAYTIVLVDNEPIKAVRIQTDPVPANANSYDEFGYSETFTHWPDTILE